jgi:hypothetical protein
MSRLRQRPERSAAASPRDNWPAQRSSSRSSISSVWSALAVVVAGVVGGTSACADDPLGDLKTVQVADAAGRQRFVVTLAGAAPDLGEYRRLLKENPSGVAGYVEGRRAALVRPDVDAAITGASGHVVERWWMSGQLTVELAPEGVSTLRALPGIASVEADVPLR